MDSVFYALERFIGTAPAKPFLSSWCLSNLLLTKLKQFEWKILFYDHMEKETRTS